MNEHCVSCGMPLEECCGAQSSLERLADNVLTFTLEVDQFKNYYQTVEQGIDEIRKQEHFLQLEELDEETVQRCIAARHIVELQFYPDTPVGSYCLYGASVDEVVERALNIVTAARALREAIAEAKNTLPTKQVYGNAEDLEGALEDVQRRQAARQGVRS